MQRPEAGTISKLPPRIAVVFEYPSVNGGEESMLSVLSHLHPHRYECAAIAPPSGPLAQRLAELRVPVCEIEWRPPKGTRVPPAEACSRLRESVHQVAPHLIHANSLSMGRFTGALADELGIPAVAHLRDIIRLNPTARNQLSANQRLIAVSHATADYHCAQGLDAARTCVIHNGVDTQRFRPRPASGWLRQQLGVSPASVLILSVGQICLRKGQDVLVHAAARLAGENVQTDWVLVGKRHSTKAESIAFEESLDAGFRPLEPLVKLHRLGYRGDVDRLMNECDLLVHPARQEPFGRVLLEAAASGLPIVATDVGGTCELLEHDVSALLMKPNDSNALAAAILQFKNDPLLRKRLSTQARQRVESEFTVERAASDLARVWDELLISSNSLGECGRTTARRSGL